MAIEEDAEGHEFAVLRTRDALRDAPGTRPRVREQVRLTKLYRARPSRALSPRSRRLARAHPGMADFE
jgi:hypothetical protein